MEKKDEKKNPKNEIIDKEKSKKDEKESQKKEPKDTKEKKSEKKSQKPEPKDIKEKETIPEEIPYSCIPKLEGKYKDLSYEQ